MRKALTVIGFSEDEVEVRRLSLRANTITLNGKLSIELCSISFEQTNQLWYNLPGTQYEIMQCDVGMIDWEPRGQKWKVTLTTITKP